MKIHVAAVCETELLALVPHRGQYSAHTLTADPESSDLILLVGSFGRDAHWLLDHPLYRRFSEKCAIYTEDDNYLPLAPGVYCSALLDENHRAGRIFSYSYVSSSGKFSNPFVLEAGFQKKYLFTFLGGSTSWVRKRMFNLSFNRSDVLIENTSTYYHWDLTQPGREARQKRYAEILASSHFVLCPRGAGTGTIRLFEVMKAGIAPVLISDGYPLPPNVPWDKFLLRFDEKDIARLPELIEPHIEGSRERGRLARDAWLQHFAPEKEFDAIVALASASLRHGPPAESDFRRRQARLIARKKLYETVRGIARAAFLKALKVFHIKSPWQLNR